MRRRKDDKRVLRPGNGRNNKRNRRAPNLSFNRNKSRRNNPVRSNNRVKKEKKRSKKTVLLMILVLFAFVIGAGAGVLMSFDDGNENNETHIQNVTIEMTSNLTNNSNQVTFDEGDDVDYNQNASSGILGAEDNPYYNVDEGH
ncbi:MAG: hypothetical protein IJF83_09290 [Methanobrevibacter sp.]|nr:hypothetical protein [Methanobrevibacter sp.]